MYQPIVVFNPIQFQIMTRIGRKMFTSGVITEDCDVAETSTVTDT